MDKEVQSFQFIFIGQQYKENKRKDHEEIPQRYCGNEMRCRLVPFIILLFYR